MSRPPSPNLPPCPRPGHDGSRVSLDGSYSKRNRQLVRCTLPDKSFHRFAGPLPRRQVGDGVYQTCDNAVHRHQGPVAMWKGLYQVMEISSALVEVAKGGEFTEVARRVRGNYWGLHGSGRRRADSVEGGQTVADWLNLFGPAISAHYAENHWPETLVLDSTEYQYTNPRTDYQSQPFVILAA